MKKNKLKKLRVHGDQHAREILCNRIVAFGDSLTAGNEVLDHLHPLYPYKKEWSQQKWHDEIKNNKEYQQSMHDLREKEINFSWPNQLAQLLELPIVNFAQGGNALEKICVDLILGNFVPEENDLVLIGLPPPGRYVYYSKRGIDVINAGFLHATQWPLRELDPKTMINFYTDDKFAWDYLTQLLLLRYYKEHKHKNLFVIQQWHSIDKWLEENTVHISKILEEPFARAHREIMKSNLLLFNDWHLMNGHKYLISVCEHGHPDKRTQRSMAKAIQRYIHKKPELSTKPKQEQQEQ